MLNVAIKYRGVGLFFPEEGERITNILLVAALLTTLCLLWIYIKAPA